MPKTRAEIQKAYRERKKRPGWLRIKVDTKEQHVKSIKAYAKKVNDEV